MSELLKSRHAFGSEAGIDSALERQIIDAYDILFLKEGKIGWIDADGNKVILEDKTGVMTVDALPRETGGEVNTVYICDSKFYFWDGTDFVTVEGSVSEETVNEKIDTAVSDVVNQAKAYTDEQIANAVKVEVVEF